MNNEMITKLPKQVDDINTKLNEHIQNHPTGGLAPEQQESIDKIPVIETALEDIEQKKVNKINFLDLLTNGLITKIKLIGDSVTWGGDGDGYESGDSGRVIYDNYKEMNHNTKCYANFFRSFLKAKSPNIDLLNAGINGHSTKRCNADKVKWIGTNNDVLFLILGLNDLWDCSTLQEFERNYEDVVKYSIANCNHLYICTTPTTTRRTSQNQQGFMVTDICNSIKKIANKYNLPVLDINSSTFDMASIKQVTFTAGSYFLDDDCHPSSLGHTILWMALQKELGFIGNQLDFEFSGGGNNSLIKFPKISELPTGWTCDTEPTTSDWITFVTIGNDQAVAMKTPNGKGGVLRIYNTNPWREPYEFCEQEFIDVNGRIFKRKLISANTWSEWSGKRYVVTTTQNWVTPPLQGSYYIINGNEVHLLLQLTGGNKSVEAIKIANIPPSSIDINGLALFYGSDKVFKTGLCYISKEGDLYVEGITENEKLIINLTYPI